MGAFPCGSKLRRKKEKPAVAGRSMRQWRRGFSKISQFAGLPNPESSQKTTVFLTGGVTSSPFTMERQT